MFCPRGTPKSVNKKTSCPRSTHRRSIFWPHIIETGPTFRDRARSYGVALALAMIWWGITAESTIRRSKTERNWTGFAESKAAEKTTQFVKYESLSNSRKSLAMSAKEQVAKPTTAQRTKGPGKVFLGQQPSRGRCTNGSRPSSTLWCARKRPPNSSSTKASQTARRIWG